MVDCGTAGVWDRGIKSCKINDFVSSIEFVNILVANSNHY
jgi:hypothetical protein